MRNQLLLVVSVVCASTASGQVVVPGATPKTQGAASIREVLEAGDSRARGQLPAKEGDYYTALPACSFTVVLPDSVAIVTSPGTVLRLYGWDKMFATFGSPRWDTRIERVSVADTLRAKVVDARCSRSYGIAAIQVLAQHGDLTFGVSGDEVLDVDGYASTSRTFLRVIDKNGKLDTATYRHACPDTPKDCYTLVGVRPFRDSVAKASADSAALEAKQDAEAHAKRLRTIRSKGWSSAITALVIANKIQIGMTAEMVRLSWGEPEKINTTLTSRTRHEQWVYGRGSYVYFEDGRVVSIQN